MTDPERLDRAIRYVDGAWPRSITLLVKGESPECPGNHGGHIERCPWCSNILGAIRAAYHGNVIDTASL
jgi:hypothetical protein